MSRFNPDLLVPPCFTPKPDPASQAFARVLERYRELYDRAESMAHEIERHPREALYPSLIEALEDYKGDDE